ncbi:hypothetical protein NLG97_g5715 [Lecanicillium saksenae]|uniref:Uncharacterized protein n=1 Tax=Lecanicillium saksenae TaxID=468837 RepID=A0ACC1QS85_9HYPO|nr:hypothetical protein NLG97_g5715 [Lecanicillium saksenae]
MASHNLFNIVRDVYATDVDGPVDAHEAAHAAHVISIVGKLVAPEAVHVGAEDVVHARQAVQVVAVDALGADAPGEAHAEEAAGEAVSLCVSRVGGDVAAALGLGLRVAVVVAPDHLLYQMLKVVPVWGGGSEVMSEGSICTRAGFFFLRMIFLTTFLPVGAAGTTAPAPSAAWATCVSSSAMAGGVSEKSSWEVAASLERAEIGIKTLRLAMGKVLVPDAAASHRPTTRRGSMRLANK